MEEEEEGTRLGPLQEVLPRLHGETKNHGVTRPFKDLLALGLRIAPHTCPDEHTLALVRVRISCRIPGLNPDRHLSDQSEQE